MNIFYYFIIFILLFLIEIFYFRIANRFNIIDKPNLRSSHSKITLRGGGIIFYFSVLFFFLTHPWQYPWFMLGLTIISFISFVDDIHPVSQLPRLILHFTGMFCMFYEWNIFNLPWAWTLVALIVCTGIINAYNFMDGINGITGGYSLVIIGVLIYVNHFISNFINQDFLVFVLLGLIVFNYFNFRKKAKCFAGDIGSVSIAFIILFLLGKLIILTNDLSWIILLVAYGVDSVLTIIHRIILKENIGQPHRKHLYQIMANELKISHIKVSALYMTVQLIIASIYIAFPSYHWTILISSICVLSIGYILFMKIFFNLHVVKM